MFSICKHKSHWICVHTSSMWHHAWHHTHSTKQKFTVLQDLYSDPLLEKFCEALIDSKTFFVTHDTYDDGTVDADIARTHAAGICRSGNLWFSVFTEADSAANVWFGLVWDPFLVNLNLNLRFGPVWFRLHKLNLSSGSERFGSGGSRFWTQFKPVDMCILYYYNFFNFFQFFLILFSYGTVWRPEFSNSEYSGKTFWGHNVSSEFSNHEKYEKNMMFFKYFPCILENKKFNIFEIFFILKYSLSWLVKS
jgi:hypothetical protein